MNDKITTIIRLMVGFWILLISVSLVGLLSIKGKEIETNLFPVASSFELQKSSDPSQPNPSWVGDELRIYGAFKKDRDCKYVPGNLTGYFIEPNGAQTRSAFRSGDQPKNSPYTRIVGLHNFGPWFFLAGPAVRKPTKMFIEVLHPCRTWAISKWFFGPMTRTVFGPFDIPQRKDP